MQRMLDDYYRSFYSPLFESSKQFKSEEFKQAKALSNWKAKIRSWWNEINIENMIIPDPNNGGLDLKKDFEAEIKLEIPGLDMEDIGIEVLFGNKNHDGQYIIHQVEPLKPVKREQDIVSFTCRVPMLYSGVHDYAFRVYPKNELLSSRMDFPLVKWL